MKSFCLKLLFLTLLVSSFSCQSWENEEILRQDSQARTHFLTAEDATEMAAKFFNVNSRKGTNILSQRVLKAKSALSSRNIQNLNDTVAYIFNNGNNNGFVVISADTRIFPILAYSRDGHLSFAENDDDIIYSNFLSLIEQQINQLEEDAEDVEYDEEVMDGCYTLLLNTGTNWHQHYPFNKYVDIDYPNCVVGCVPLTIGHIMVNAFPTTVYNGKVYYFSSIKEALDSVHNYTPMNSSRTSIRRISGGHPDTSSGSTPTYSYDQALDLVGQLLYDIGRDLNVTYDTLRSGTPPSKGYEFLSRFNMDIPQDSLTRYSQPFVIKYLYEGYNVYMRGLVNDSNLGHAWLADGCSFCWQSQLLKDITKIRNAYIHCDWGWGGNGNGYYSGATFSLGANTVHSMEYFAIKQYE
ncbi:MAG: C10 family peptidase [Bacteroidales bacterium]|nr:C10 family peptidase [Bacteroidales bacterium]